MFPLLMLCTTLLQLSEATELVKALKRKRFRNANLQDGSEDLQELSNLIAESDIDARESGCTALRYASSKTFTGENAKAICERLLEKGANVNTRDAFGITPLMQSAYEGDRDLTECLLRKGANPFRCNAAGNTALDRAKANSQPFVGVSFNKNRSKWDVKRWSKYKRKTVSNGSSNDERAAARASDSLARHLMENGDHGLKFNFPANDEEVRPPKFFEKFPNHNEYDGVPKGDCKYNADCVSLLQNCMNESWAMINARQRTSLKEPMIMNFEPIRYKINEFLGNFSQ